MLFAFLALCCLPGCAWKITPPQEISNGRVPVYVTEYGRHTRVALQDTSNRFVEFGFGEWNFYGEEKTGALSGLRAILGFGTPAISRREVMAADDVMLFQRAASGGRTARLLVSESRAARLREKLEQRWLAADADRRIRSWDAVPVSKENSGRYHLLRNSNSEAAKWLEELGCEVHGLPIGSNWRIEEADR